ncbi:MAG: hybrid sensor histidine kinase/response regulator [Beggiatoa sp. IS2]|nr:MAG: hybrid sensor histidine kinase/response regulator [Beggiatoa sp. IS2]
MSLKSASRGTLLIVDDIPENVSVLFNFLIANGFKVLVAEDGENALEKAIYARPHLILLDVIMPGIDGFETCYRLKSDARTREIPVVFMTALADTLDKVRGFELGAVDYVTKPFHQEEVLARINTHLMIRNLQRELQTQNEELDAFGHTVAHDLKNPLNAVIALSELLMETHKPAQNAKTAKHLEMISRSAKTMESIINALLLLAGLSKQEVELEPLDMGKIVTEVRQRVAFICETYHGNILIPDQWPTARGYAPWVQEIWVNYLTNGLKYGGNPPEIELGATTCRKEIQFWVKDNGEGLSPEAQTQLFTPFTRIKHHRVLGHGLGLSIVQRIAERLGGRVGVESRVGEGSKFYFTLPAG